MRSTKMEMYLIGNSRDFVVDASKIRSVTPLPVMGGNEEVTSFVV